MVPEVADERDDVAIKHALRILSGEVDAGEVDAGEADDETEARESSIAATLEDTREDGTINCPEPDCLAQEGNAEDMVSHIETEHDVDSDDLAAWIGERA